MNKTETNAASLDYVYKEYVRLSERCASYVQSAFDDIKLYSACGLVLAWKPIVDTNFFDQANKSLALFLGFLALLLVVIILSIFNLLKQSLIFYYLKLLRAYESEIRAELGKSDTVAFEWTKSYPQWRKKVFLKIFLHLLLVFGLTIIVFPIIILVLQSSVWYAVLYGFISLALVGIYLSAVKIFLKQQSDINGAENNDGG